jgi:hypothetical protein
VNIASIFHFVLFFKLLSIMAFCPICCFLVIWQKKAQHFAQLIGLQAIFIGIYWLVFCWFPLSKNHLFSPSTTIIFSPHFSFHQLPPIVPQLPQSIKKNKETWYFPLHWAKTKNNDRLRRQNKVCLSGDLLDWWEVLFRLCWDIWQFCRDLVANGPNEELPNNLSKFYVNYYISYMNSQFRRD